MKTFSHMNIILLSVLAIISTAVWLVLNSILADATHVLAKSNYVWSDYGSVSVVTLIACTVVIAMILLYDKLSNGVRFVSLLLNVTVQFFLISVFSILILYFDSYLSTVGFAVVLIWASEILIGMVLTKYIASYPENNKSISKSLRVFYGTLLFQSIGVVILLIILPGISIIT